MDLAEGWYPQTYDECISEIKKLHNNMKERKLNSDYCAAIVPHAGWYYSGKLACETISHLNQNRDIDVVCVFGGHLRPEDQLVYYDVDAFETPLDAIEQDRDILFDLLNHPQLNFEMERWADNTIEIQLPFIKYFFPDSKILSFRCPPSKKSIQFAEILTETLKKNNKKAVFIGSTDLTHYGPNYQFVKFDTTEKALEWVRDVNDKTFINHCLSLDCEQILEHANRNYSACSSGAAAACITASKKTKELSQGTVYDYYTSYDIRKNSSFVGYLGMLF